MAISYQSFVKNPQQGISKQDIGTIIPSSAYHDAEIFFTAVTEVEAIADGVARKDFIASKELRLSLANSISGRSLFSEKLRADVTYFALNPDGTASAEAITEQRIEFDYNLSLKKTSLATANKIDTRKSFSVSNIQIFDISTSSWNNLLFTRPPSSFRKVPDKVREFKILDTERAEEPDYPIVAMDMYNGEILSFNSKGECSSFGGPKLVLQTEIPPNDANPSLIVEVGKTYVTRNGGMGFCYEQKGDRFKIEPVHSIFFFQFTVPRMFDYWVWENGMKNTVFDNPVASADDLVAITTGAEAKKYAYKTVIYALIPDNETDPRVAIKDTPDGLRTPKNWKFFYKRSDITTVPPGHSIYEVHVGEILNFTSQGLSYALTI